MSPNLKVANIDGVVTFLYVPPQEALHDDGNGLTQTLEADTTVLCLGTNLKKAIKLAAELDSKKSKLH